VVTTLEGLVSTEIAGVVIRGVHLDTGTSPSGRSVVVQKDAPGSPRPPRIVLTMPPAFTKKGA